MLRIWGRSNSVNVQKALWCCEEMNLPYERVDAGGTFGVVNTQQYRHLNPNGLVPTIEEDGFVLWESNAIVRYLAARHSPGKLWPEDLNIRAEADKWMDWQNTTFWPTFRPLFWNLVRTAPDQRDTQAMEESRLKTAERAAAAWPKQGAESIATGLAEYLTEEKHLLVTPLQATEFVAEVDELRDAVERLDKRIERLQRRTGGS